MDELNHAQSWYMRDLESRKRWYETVASLYDTIRPKYSEEIIGRVVELARLPPGGRILEVGCGPGTATVPFAQRGYRLVALEPNAEFFRLATWNCARYPQVTLRQVSFEEWTLEKGGFDAVLAATSFHWIPSEIAYPKAADALCDKGSLILLWNMTAQLAPHVCQVLADVYATYAPNLGQDEFSETQEDSLRSISQLIMASGRFREIVADQRQCHLSYSTEQYLALLTTYSPYIALDAKTRELLLAGLRERLDRQCAGRVELSYLSAFHVARKQE